MRITVKEIARLAGVSRGTVDRVIHNRYGVDPEVKERVNEIIAQLGYRPNPLARALKSKKNIKPFGVIIPNLQNLFFIDIEKGINDAAEFFEPYGVKIIKRYLKHMEPEEQVKCIQDLYADGIGGLILPAIDCPEVTQIIDQNADEIPTITYNTDLTNSSRLCFVGQNAFLNGQVAADLMGRYIKEAGQILITISQKNLLAHAGRVRGFEGKIMSDYPHLKICDALETYESDEMAYKIVSEKLQKDSNITGIYAAGGGQGGVGAALEASGFKDRIMMVSCDMIPKTVELVINGVIDFTIGQEPYVQGYMPVKMMYENIVLGMKPKFEHLYTHIDIRTRDTVLLKGHEIFVGEF